MKQLPKRNRLIIKMLMLIPIGFLLFYHTTKLYNIYFGTDIANSDEFLNSFSDSFPIATILIIQCVFRLTIIAGLILILFEKNMGLLFMWLGILLLIASQFFIASASGSELIHAIHSGLKPLKGLILPGLITFLYKRQVRLISKNYKQDILK